MFNAYPPSDEALWLLEYVLFGFWWHPVQWFGWIAVASITICIASTWRGALVTAAVLLLLVLYLPAGLAWEFGPCVLSETDDCKGGFWVGSMTQCPNFDGLRCEQFETATGVCYGIRNPGGCVAGSGAHHYRRSIFNKTNIPLCPVWETGRQWVARPCPFDDRP